MHDDEIRIDAPLVRALVNRAFPQFVSRPLRALDSFGSSNALFRLGDDLLVRLPRLPGGSQTILKEQRWLPHVASALSVAVPRVVAVGVPDLGYREHWSIVEWIDGQVPTVPVGPEVPTDQLASDLARVLLELRDLFVPPRALDDPALHSYRAEPLTAIDTSIRDSLSVCRTLRGLDLDIGACLRVWEYTMGTFGDEPNTPPHWLHGDLLAENLLIREGKLAAVLDFGGLSIGDPTVDLVAGWELLDPQSRNTFRSAVGIDDETWLRGRAWALAIGVMTFPYYWKSMPYRCASRLEMVRAVLADARAD